ncbi:MAG: hypothetical protein ACIAXF_10785, partial [Phycisphaerales bacterium JB063]
VAFVVLAGAIAATMLLTPSINSQRIERQLTYDMTSGDNANAQYTLLASTGSFRGIAVNVLWYRIEKLKNEGKFAEANALARSIVSLQPRFPGAWEFMAWNMAYNISVQCNTAEERWYWVNNGLNLLRDEGIPNNPRSIQLYRQLSWTLSHKMGGRTDDMHWYYKREFAEEWETVLFAPMPGRDPKPVGNRLAHPADWHNMTPDQFYWTATSQFRDVDSMAQDYLRKPEAPEELWSPDHYFDTITPEARQRFYDEHPGIERFVQRLEALRGPAGEDLGLGLNSKTLRAFGYRNMLIRAGYNINDPALRGVDGLPMEVQAIMDLMDANEANAEPTPDNPYLLMPSEPRDRRAERMEVARAYGRVTQQQINAFNAQSQSSRLLDLGPMLDLLRAKTLVSDYHMDPGYMMWLMDEYGPIDWRHVNSHALYWSSLGTIMALDKNNRSQIDFINNDRQTIHAVQGLAYAGTLVFRPRVEQLGPEIGAGTVQTMVDTRFFEAYDMALTRTRELIESGEFGDVNEGTYDTGYENFLHAATMYSYYGGQTGLARRYFNKLKESFGGEGSTSAYAADYEVYANNLAGFAYERLISDDLYDSKVGYLSQLLDRAWREGMVQRDPTVTRRYLDAATQFYDKIKEDYASSSVNAGTDTQDRMSLIDLEQQKIQTFLRVITDPSYSLPQRSAMWNESIRIIEDLQTQYEIYEQMAQPLANQMAQQGFEIPFTDVFTMPQGFREWYDALIQRREAEQNNNADPELSNQ